MSTNTAHDRFAKALEKALDEYYHGWRSHKNTPIVDYHPDTVNNWRIGKTLPTYNGFTDFLNRYPFDDGIVRETLQKLFLAARKERDSKRKNKTPDKVITEKVNNTPEKYPKLYYIVILGNKYTKNNVFIVSRNDMIVGRSLECNIVVNIPFVSRKHFMLSFYDGFYTVTDLQSKNGTILNGEKLKTPAQIKDGDVISINELFFVITTNPFRYNVLSDTETEPAPYPEF